MRQGIALGLPNKNNPGPTMHYNRGTPLPLCRCRVQEYSSIVPRHPQQASESPGEVILDFEAFMLDSRVKESSQLWIHTTIKACIDFRDCMAVSAGQVELVFTFKAFSVG